MEFNADAVANRIIMIIAGLSALLAVVGVFLFMHLAENPDASAFAAILGISSPEHSTIMDAIPFAVGIGAASAVNIVKMLLLKRAVKNAVERDASAARNYLRSQYLMRLFVMAAVLLAAGLLHSNAVNEAGNPMYVNFMGAFFGILVFPVANYAIRFFLRDTLDDNPDLYVKPESKSATQSAIDELEKIGTDKEE